MKKILLAFSLTAVVLLTATSCKKIISAIFGGLDVTVPDIRIPIQAYPILPVNEITMGTVNMNFNLDSIIREKTGGVFDIDDIKSVKVKQYVVTIPEADALNNLANFEYAKVRLTSNNNRTEVEVASINLPDTYAASTTIQPSNSPELITYLKGSQLSYVVSGKARRITTKPLTIVVSVTVRVE